MDAKGNFRKNLKKVKDSDPDLKGKWTDADGRVYWLSVWRNVDTNTGDMWFSAKCGDEVQEQTAPARQSPPRAAPPKTSRTQAAIEQMDDDVPF
jgi:hypothetical protein